jgi:serine/threonine-protein kinase
LNESASALNDPFTSSLAGRRLGRYEVLARLASGGMAGVYVARALGVAGFERLFAIKVLHPHLAHEEEFISMFLDEARLAARIRHPNVVPTIDISDTEDAGYFLVMDYIEGDHLGALLQQAYRRGTRLPASVSLRICVDALNGLGAAHALTDENGQRINLVHRDVSPHNIMVSTDGIARITDFGVAKAEVRLSTTQDGQFKGKLAYMAPEHASNGEADQRSDLFSMAIILWESLTGRRLFRAENHAATLHKICLEPIPLLSSVDPALAPFDDVLARGLERDRDLRYQSAEEFGEALEERAHLLDGVANPRAVAKLVREYAIEKLERDQNLVRAAMSEIAASGGADSGAAPVYVAPARSRIATPMVMPAAATPPPIVAPPSVEANAIDVSLDEAGRPRSRTMPIVVGVLALLAIAFGAAALWLEGKPGAVESAPLAVPQPVEPSPAAPSVDPAAPPTAGGSGATTEGDEVGLRQPASGSSPETPGAAAKPPAPLPQPEATVAPTETDQGELKVKSPKNKQPRPKVPKGTEDEELMLNPYRK